MPIVGKLIKRCVHDMPYEWDPDVRPDDVWECPDCLGLWVLVVKHDWKASPGNFIVRSWDPMTEEQRVNFERTLNRNED